MRIQLHYKDGRRETISVPWSEPRSTVEIADPPAFDFRIDAPPLLRTHRAFRNVDGTDVYEEI
jgi:hypothetical protein